MCVKTRSGDLWLGRRQPVCGRCRGKEEFIDSSGWVADDSIRCLLEDREGIYDRHSAGGGSVWKSKKVRLITTSDGLITTLSCRCRGWMEQFDRLQWWRSKPGPSKPQGTSRTVESLASYINKLQGCLFRCGARYGFSHIRTKIYLLDNESIPSLLVTAERDHSGWHLE